MIAPAITRRLKLDPLIRTIAGGGVSVAGTKHSVANTVTQLSKRFAMSRESVFVDRNRSLTQV